MSGALELVYKDGKSLMRFTSYGISGESVTGFDGKRWWRHLPGADEPQEITGEDRALVQNFALFTPQFLRWRDFQGTTQVTDTAEFRGTPVWHLKFTDPDGLVVDRYFDRDNGLLVSDRTQAGRVQNVMLYEFTEINGVQWVSVATVETTVDSVESEYDVQLRFDDFDFDVDLDDEQFALPEDR